MGILVCNYWPAVVQLFDNRGSGSGLLLANNEQTGARICQDIYQFRHSQTPIKRHQYGARTGTGEQGFNYPRAVVTEVGDPVPLHYSKFMLEDSCEFGNCAGQTGVTVLLITEDDGGFVGGSFCPVADPVVKVHC